jgi:hypothetical protein
VEVEVWRSEGAKIEESEEEGFVGPVHFKLADALESSYGAR